MEKKEKSIDILDMMIILAKYKKFLLISLLMVSVLSVSYSLLLTKKWTSYTTLSPTAGESTNTSLVSAYLGSSFKSLMGNESNNSDIITVLLSRKILGKIVQKFNLVEYYEIEGDDSYIIEETIISKMREEIINVGQDIESGVITIYATTNDRFLSSQIANYMVAELENYNKNLRMTMGKKERQFLEKRLEEVNNESNQVLERIREFQIKYNVIELEKQLPSLLTIYSDLVAKYISEEIKYDFSKKFISEDNMLIQEIKVHREVIKKQIKNLEEGNSQIVNYQIPLDQIPKISQQYQLLKLRSEILKKTYNILYPQYEGAKIQEIRDTPTIQIIDVAIPAGLRSWPKRASLCVTIFLASAFALSLLVIVREVWIDRLNRDENLRNKVDEFKKNLFGK